jgi:hypothetical protein
MKRVGIRLGQLSLTLVVTWFILTRVGVDLAALREVNGAEWTPNLWMLAASCIVLLCGYLFSAGLWGRIVRDSGDMPRARSGRSPAWRFWRSVKEFLVGSPRGPRSWGREWLSWRLRSWV